MCLYPSPHHRPVPARSDDWRGIAANFQVRWNFPHRLGAIDGKPASLKAPWNCRSVDRNYRGTFSLVVMALVDASLNSICVDAGSNGHNSDRGIFSPSNLGKAISRALFNFPADASLLDAPHLGALPYVIVWG